jgi:hypothetical protein
MKSKARLLSRRASMRLLHYRRVERQQGDGSGATIATLNWTSNCS